MKNGLGNLRLAGNDLDCDDAGSRTRPTAIRRTTNVLTCIDNPRRGIPRHPDYIHPTGIFGSEDE